MRIGRWLILLALHESYWVFGILIGKIDLPEEEKAIGIVINLGAGGVIIGYKL